LLAKFFEWHLLVFHDAADRLPTFYRSPDLNAKTNVPRSRSAATVALPFVRTFTLNIDRNLRNKEQ
jgi:hypothetical protein